MERNIESKSEEPVVLSDDWLAKWRAGDADEHCGPAEYSDEFLCGVSDAEVRDLIKTKGFVRGTMVPVSQYVEMPARHRFDIPVVEDVEIPVSEDEDIPTFEDEEAFTEYAQTCGKMHTHMQMSFDIFCDRHKKYGPENISKGGLAFLEARRNDKLARIRHSGDDFTDESRDDAYYDMSNYWLIELMVVKGEWPMMVTDERAGFLRFQIAYLQGQLDALEGKLAV